MRIENNRGQVITTIEEWHALAPPASAHQWREHRSAFELARAWIERDAADRLRGLLASSPAFADVSLELAIAERKTRFDDIPGGVRNHDLLVLAHADSRPIVIGVEAKADEPFDRNLSDFCAAALKRSPRTRAPERLDRLTRAFFATTLVEEASLGTLRYQLFSALAGTLAEAKLHDAVAAVLVIHEFVTPLTASAKQRLNDADLDAFATRLGATPRTAGPGDSWLAGPAMLTGNGDLHAAIPVYLGKLTTDTRQTPAASATSVPARRDVPAAPPSRGRRGNAARRARATIDVGGGRTVIKLNVHPPGCRCGCASRGERSFVVNRPGEHVPNRWTNDLDEAITQMRDWALDALRTTPSVPARGSAVDVGGGMTAITLTVHPAMAPQRFVVTLLEQGEIRASDHLDEAVGGVRLWAEQAMGR